MKTMLILVILFAAEAASAVSPALCMAQCRKITEGKATGMQCAVRSIQDYGALMFLTIPLGALTPDQTIQSETLKECFFAAGGTHFEMDAIGGKSVLACGRARTESGYFCEAIEPSRSMRKIAFKGERREKP